MGKNIVFDFYGTLVDIHTDEESPVLWKRLAALYTVYGAEYTGTQLKRTYRMFVREAEEALGKELATEFPEIRLEDVFLRLLDEAPRVHETCFSITDRIVWADVVANFFRVLSRRRLAAFPGTVPTLQALRERGYALYLLSNAQRVFTVPEIEQTGVMPFLTDISISSDFGMKKPEPRFLQSLMEKHGMEPEETVMVGNDFTSDMGIASAVGIDGIFLNSFAYPPAELKRRNTTHVPVIQSIEEILKFF